MLVGRHDELQAARRLLSSGRSLALVGRAGIGKTTLAEAAAESAGVVHWGGGVAGLSWRPYLALERAIRQELAFGDGAFAAAHVVAHVGDGVLVIDDLQWCASTTLAVLPLLAARIRVLAVVRLGDEGTARAVEAARAARLVVQTLRPLPRPAARELLAQERRELSAESVERVLRTARGNPLLLRELSGEGVPSQSLELSLRARLAQAPDEAREVFVMLGLAGRPIALKLLPTAATDALDALGLVRVDGSLVEVAHDRLGEALVERTAPASLRRLHARLAALLDDDGGAARHLAAAGMHEEAVERALAAASRARSADERALHLCVAADSSPRDAGGDVLRLRAADALIGAGAFGDAERVVMAVCSNDRFVRAEALLHRGRAAWALGRSDPANQSFRSGLDLVRGSRTPVEVRLRVAQCQPRLNDGRTRRAVAAARRAVQLADELRVHRAEAHVELASALYWLGDPDALEQGAAARELAREERNVELELRSLGGLAAIHQIRLQAAAARRILRTGGRLAAANRLRSWELQFSWLLAHVEYHSLGNYASVIPQLREIVADPAFGQSDPDQATADLAITLADVGRTAEARATLRTHGTGGRASWGRGTLAHARAELDWLLRRPESVLRTVDRWASANTEANLVAQMRALDGYARLDLRLPRLPPPPPTGQPLIDLWRLECEALALVDRPREAEERFLDAAASWHRNGVRYRVRCLWAAGEMALRAGATTRARRYLATGERQALQYGLIPMLGRIRGSLRQAGIFRHADRGTGPHGLTIREGEVLTLVGEGQTTVEIAAALGITAHTVDSLVRSARTKLGASTRRSAAALAVDSSA